MPYLIIKQYYDDEVIGTYEITKDITTIGREQNCDMVLNDPRVSQSHAEILSLEDGSYEIKDMGSTNHTKVNGQIKKCYQLKDGDEIGLGDSLLIFRNDYEYVEYESADANNIDISSIGMDRKKLECLYRFSNNIHLHLGNRNSLFNDIKKEIDENLKAEYILIAPVDSEKKGIDLAQAILFNYKEEDEMEISTTIIRKVCETHKSILEPNAVENIEYKDSASINRFRIKSIMCAPLICRNELLGVVYLQNRTEKGSFSKADLEFLTVLCNNASIAIDNDRLYDRILKENQFLTKNVESECNLVCKSKQMLELVNKIDIIAPSDLSVILVGETGSGKEVLAETIHKKSLRKGKFVTINCGGLDDNLIQDTFFGHVKGAFNNAYSSRIGAFEEAEGGTLFLDEINNLSLNTQEKLLRVLDGKKFRKIGSNIDIEPKFRIISATNQDLKKLITNGKFKEDLYYRLAGQVFKIPPIRERKEDIIPLLEYFLEREGSSINKISEDAKILMLSYNWPGNVRQLHSCIKSAAFFAKGREIQPQHIIAAEESLQHVIPFDKPILNIKQIERDNIINVLKSKGWNIAESAEILKISRQTLYNKIKKDEYLKSEFEDARVKV